MENIVSYVTYMSYVTSHVYQLITISLELSTWGYWASSEYSSASSAIKSHWKINRSICNYKNLQQAYHSANLHSSLENIERKSQEVAIFPDHI